ncbi:DUF262 domain-containing HNH endonuclease family protein [Campylobacter sp.]|uniref:DUF262 domain-containing protein n=1 Tax=Campylobacter sp. TaxID=205 RepID=UPI002A837D84|nr:DUF262 domain-containing HNH endonuclease family protein [Campylobacter sp.]MDY4155167.1 DUF262 domain-containing HNH endonuclease family protein [Campylobacter sp.]
MRFEPKQRFILNMKDRENQKFLIPEYQRPYSWEIDECETLWNDIVNIFEEKKENKNVEYFLGSIVSFENKDENSALEIIDGQQRITTLTLLFRAFYASFTKETVSEDKQGYLFSFGGFIWERDPATYKFMFDKPFLESNVITNRDKEVLEEILKENLDVDSLRKSNSNYAKNFVYFFDTIETFKSNRPLDFGDLCSTILRDTFFVLCVTCDSQESAMTIFNTLNSRGVQLSNADIIKGYIYKNTKNKEEFSKKWKYISSIFEEYNPKEDMSILFNQTMFSLRVINNATKKNLPAVVNFFTKNSKNGENFGANKYLTEQEKIDELMDFIESLVCFWSDPKTYLKEKAYRYFCVLKLLKNDVWKYYVSFLIWRNKQYFTKDEFSKEFNEEFEVELLKLLKETTANILRGKSTTDNMHDLVFKMSKCLNKAEKYIDNEPLPALFLENFSSNDNNRKPDTKKVKYILYLYAHLYNKFSSDIDDTKLQVEHILPRAWQNINFGDWNAKSHSEYLEQIGNKILLDKESNIKCGNDFFSSKQEKYKNHKNSQEVRDLGNRENKIWSKADIEARNKAIEKALRDFVAK